MFKLYRIAGVLCRDLRINKICDSLCRSQYVENRVSANNTNVLYRTLHYYTCKSTPTLLRILTPSGSQPLTLSSTKVFNTQAYLTRGIHHSQKTFNNGLGSKPMSQGTKSTLYYIAAVGVLALGLSYAAVPLYRIFCQVSYRSSVDPMIYWLSGNYSITSASYLLMDYTDFSYLGFQFSLWLVFITARWIFRESLHRLIGTRWQQCLAWSFDWWYKQQ